MDTVVETPMDPKRFQREGIVFPFTLFEGEAAVGLIDRYAAFQARARVLRDGHDLFIKGHLVSTWLDSIVHHPLVLDVAEAVLGPDLLLWSSDFFVKTAGSRRHVSLHQDTVFWGLEPPENVVSVWLAITPSTLRSGAMQVVRGSHRHGLLGPVLEKRDSNDILSKEQDVRYDYGPGDVVDVVLEPGQFSIHHSNILHGGVPNEADYDRVGYVMRFITPDTRQVQAPDSALLVRGEDRFGHYLAERRPRTDFDPEDMARLERIFPLPSGFGDQVVR